MTDADQKTLRAEDLTQPQPESTDPAYLAWRDAQVRAALADAKAHPEKMISEREIWKKFGIEY